MSRWENSAPRFCLVSATGISILRNWLTTSEDVVFDLRTLGRHNLFAKNGIDALINLQSDGSTAKRY